MIPPENAWLRRSNNDIIIGCYSSQQTWQLHCDGREWKGLVGTCPELCKLFKRMLQITLSITIWFIGLKESRRRSLLKVATSATTVFSLYLCSVGYHYCLNRSINCELVRCIDTGSVIIPEENPSENTGMYF